MPEQPDPTAPQEAVVTPEPAEAATPTAEVAPDGATTPAEAEPAAETSTEKILAPEDEAAPESAERIQAAEAALQKLVNAAKNDAHPFKRKIVKVEYVHDPNTIDPENGRMGAIVSRNVEVPSGDEALKTIDLRTYPSADTDEAYFLSVSFPEVADGAPRTIMLSIESPIDLGFRFDLVDAARAGVFPLGRRLQDFLYTPGASAVPVRQADFSYALNYRPIGDQTTFEATQGHMDVMYGLLADAHVGDRSGAKVVDLVPEFADLVRN